MRLYLLQLQALLDRNKRKFLPNMQFKFIENVCKPIYEVKKSPNVVFNETLSCLSYVQIDTLYYIYQIVTQFLFACMSFQSITSYFPELSELYERTVDNSRQWEILALKQDQEEEYDEAINHTESKIEQPISVVYSSYYMLQ